MRHMKESHLSNARAGDGNIELTNGISIQLLKDGGEFLGLGEIRQGNTLLRSDRLPMFVEIRNPYGVQLQNYQLERIKQTANSAVLTFGMNAVQNGPMEWQLHECRRMYNNTDWTEKPRRLAKTRLKLTIKSVTRRIDGKRFAGFSYQYAYTSDEAPIYMLLDRGSWELGGKAVGNEFWWRSCFAPAIRKIKSEADHYSSEWYHPECRNPNIFQFLPLQTDGQGFTMTCAEAGVLLTWATRVSHIRSLFEKASGKNELVHLHEHCDDLALQLTTAPMEVLFCAGNFDRTARENIYVYMHDHVADTLHAEIGMRRERVETYGQIEDWTDADLQRFRKVGLPKLLKAGVKTVYLANHFENNMNVYGVSNMCCTVDYKVAESVGEDNLRAFCKDAQKGGAKVLMWANTSISTMTIRQAKRNGKAKRIDFLPLKGSIVEAIEKAEEPFVRNTFGAIEADHYTPEFAVLNLRDPVIHDYWMKRWRYANREIGLEGIFLDSSFNLSSDKFHYCYNDLSSQDSVTADQLAKLGMHRPAETPPAKILSMYRAHLDLMVEMQEAGYIYNNEDSGVFGTHRHGPSVEKRADNLLMWADHICGFDQAALKKAGLDPDDFFFRGLAHRMMWNLYWDIKEDKLSFSYMQAKDPDDIPTPWHLSLFEAYNEVEAHMRRRRILPDERGVLYTDDDRRVLWSFAECSLPLGQLCAVRRMLTGETWEADELEAAEHQVYLIETLNAEH